MTDIGGARVLISLSSLVFVFWLLQLAIRIVLSVVGCRITISIRNTKSWFRFRKKRTQIQNIGLELILL